MVVEAGEQAQAQAEAAAAMAVGFLEQAKDFQAADDVLDADALAGQGAIVGLLLLAQGLAPRQRLWWGARLLAWRLAPRPGRPLSANSSLLSQCRRKARALEELEVVLAPLAAGRRQNQARGLIHRELALFKV